MTISRISSSGTSATYDNYGRNIMKFGSNLFFVRPLVDPSGWYPSLFNATLEGNQQERQFAAWNLGSGSVVNGTGTLLFDFETVGLGALSEVSIKNLGFNTVYIGINSKTISVASGYQLASGETYTVRDGIIRQLWACTVGGSGTNATLIAGGPFAFNSSTI